MKFKYTGQLPVKDGDLVVAGIFKSSDVIKNGTIFEVPDTDTLLIQRVMATGNYEKVETPIKIAKPKKEDKKENNKEEDK